MTDKQSDPLELEQELHALCDRVFEHCADPDQVRRIESLVLGHPDLLTIYAQRCQEHAVLDWNAGSSRGQFQRSLPRSTQPHFQSLTRRGATWG